MRKQPLISIGILNYNGLKYLKKTIPPILKLSYPNYEIIVTDNNSSDESVKYLSKFKKIKVIKNKENFGYSKGKNICVKNCKGKYILLLDDDIKILNRDCLNKFLKFYQNKKDIGFLAPIFKDKGKIKTKYYGIFFSFYGLNVHKKKIEISKLNKKESIKIGAFHGGAVFLRKKIWNKLGGYDKLQNFMLDDFDLGSKAYLFGYVNYLYVNEELTHLGKNKDINKKHFAKKFNQYFSGIATMMWKNYNLKNLILKFPVFLIYSVFLYLGLAIIKKNYLIVFSLFKSYNLFLKNLPIIIKKRKEIQSKRIIKKDIFLKIKPPKFD